VRVLIPIRGTCAERLDCIVVPECVITHRALIHSNANLYQVGERDDPVRLNILVLYEKSSPQAENMTVDPALLARPTSHVVVSATR
jgi:hypothetical protein